jgi:hypothetical protein
LHHTVDSIDVEENSEKGTSLWRSMTKELDRKQDSHVGRGFGDGRMSHQGIFRMIKKRCSAGRRRQLSHPSGHRHHGPPAELRFA